MGIRRLAACCLVFLAACASHGRSSCTVSLATVSQSTVSPSTVSHETDAREGDPEARYHAILALADRPGARTEQVLLDVLGEDDLLLQNAAARVLAGFGDERGTAVLIDHLDPDHRTWAVTDASFHLHALHGEELAYEPNLGYRVQADQQQAWRDRFGAPRIGHRITPLATDKAQAFADAYETLEPHVDAYLASEATGDEADWEATRKLWEAIAALQKSRKPAHLDLTAKAFGAMAARWPGSASLANNHALTALNNGEHDVAEAAYRRALELAPDEAYFHNDYGILLEGLGRLEEAEVQYGEAIRLDPMDDVWWCNRADVRRKRGNAKGAIRDYREAEKLAPEKWQYHRLWISRLSRP